MSTAAIATVSTALKRVLERGGTGMSVVLADPTEENTGNLVVWLYQVTVDEFTRNRSPAQVESANGRTSRLKLPPLGVNLFYLIAPMVDDQYAAQTALAAAMLALYETPQFAVELPGAEVSELVRVSFVPDTMDERAKLWEAVSKPYRLSVCYQVRTVRLVSKQVSSDAAIISTAAGIEEKPAPRVVE